MLTKVNRSAAYVTTCIVMFAAGSKKVGSGACWKILIAIFWLILFSYCMIRRSPWNAEVAAGEMTGCTYVDVSCSDFAIVFVTPFDMLYVGVVSVL